jgi:hypothetical protein
MERPEPNLIRSPQTIAEWKLCRPGDTIELLGFTVHVTEQNYQPIMDELDWYIGWFEGGLLADWILPNPNPSKLTRFQLAVDKAYIASGFIKVLAKYADKTEKQPGFWDRLKMIFGGGVPLND